MYGVKYSAAIGLKKPIAWKFVLDTHKKTSFPTNHSAGCHPVRQTTEFRQTTVVAPSRRYHQHAARDVRAAGVRGELLSEPHRSDAGSREQSVGCGLVCRAEVAGQLGGAMAPAALGLGDRSRPSSISVSSNEIVLQQSSIGVSTNEIVLQLSSIGVLTNRSV